MAHPREFLMFLIFLELRKKYAHYPKEMKLSQTRPHSYRISNTFYQTEQKYSLDRPTQRIENLSHGAYTLHEAVQYFPSMF